MRTYFKWRLNIYFLRRMITVKYDLDLKYDVNWIQKYSYTKKIEIFLSSVVIRLWTVFPNIT